MRVLDAVLATLGSARLTRVITTDDIGWWYIRVPAYRWAQYDPESERGPESNRQRLVSGLECKWCIGYWVGAAVLAGLAISPPGSTRGRVLRWVLATLAVNYLAAQGDTIVDRLAGADQ